MPRYKVRLSRVVTQVATVTVEGTDDLDVVTRSDELYKLAEKKWRLDPTEPHDRFRVFVSPVEG